MKILCVIEKGTWIEPHIVDSLKELGYQVHVYYYGKCVGEFYGIARYAERLLKNRKLVNLAKRLVDDKSLDLIFCYVYDDFLLPEAAKALSRLDVPMVNYNVDMVSQWYRQIRTAKYFTRILCAQRDNMNFMVQYNPKVLYFPMAASKSLFLENNSTPVIPTAPVTFVGSAVLHRRSVLSSLHSAGIPLAIYGNYWKQGLNATAPTGFEKSLNDLLFYAWPKLRSEGLRGLLRALKRRFVVTKSLQNAALPKELLKGVLPKEALSSFFCDSKINLGFTRIIGDSPDRAGFTQIKLRDFEIPLAGGFYLVEHVNEYAEMFKTGIEVETWRTVPELIDKIKYYLVHPEKRRQIAEAGRKRAEAEHTWNKRFSMLFDELRIR